MSQNLPLDATRQALERALEESRVRNGHGHDPEAFRKLLGKQRARRLDAYLARQHCTIEQALQAATASSLPLVEALTPQPNRQALAEKAYLDHLQSGLSSLFFKTPVVGLPRAGRGAFVPCPGVSRSADAFGRSGARTTLATCSSINAPITVVARRIWLKPSSSVLRSRRRSRRAATMASCCARQSA